VILLGRLVPKVFTPAAAGDGGSRGCQVAILSIITPRNSIIIRIIDTQDIERQLFPIIYFFLLVSGFKIG
jgi:hypothetical protein